MQVVLAMFRSDGSRRSFSITRDMTVFGRRDDCDFRIPLGEISRKHCRLMKTDGVLKIEDLGSSNGTFVNGQRVQEHTLEPGDTLKIGAAIFVVQIDGEPGDDDLAPKIAKKSRPASAPEAVTQFEPTAAVDAADFDPLSALADPEDSAMDDVVDFPADLVEDVHRSTEKDDE